VATRAPTNPNQSWANQQDADKADAGERGKWLQRARQSIRKKPLEQSKYDTN
jgi:hypothetical protein